MLAVHLNGGRVLQRLGVRPLCKEQVAVSVSKGSLDLIVSDLAYQNLVIVS
jgi:hypothetical protein